MRHWARFLTTLAVAVVAGLGTTARPARAQNPLDYIKRKAEEAKKKADEIARKADSANKATAAAKAAADSAGQSIKQTVQNPGGAVSTSGGSVQGTPPASPASSTRASAPASLPQAAASAGGGPYRLNRGAAKVEEKLLVAGESGLQYWISPREQHVAAVALRGSRQVLVYDGADGPKFDEIVTNAVSGGNGKVVFSDNGRRYAYVGRSGNEWVVMVDGKELARGSPWTQQTGQPTITLAGFSPGGGTHVWFTTAAPDSYKPVYRVYMDGTPGPVSTGADRPVFSPNGERYAYTVSSSAPGRNVYTLILDGKPSPYPGGNPLFTADGQHVFTQAAVPATSATDIYLDGKPFMHAPGAPTLHTAPAGSGVLGIVWTEFQAGRRISFLTVGNKRVAGSDCDGSGGIDKAYFSADAKHWAVRCQQAGAAYWVMNDGKKGRSYQQILSDVAFTADGRAVYQAMMNQRAFLVIGDAESDGYDSIDFMLRKQACLARAAECSPGQDEGEHVPATIRGTHVGFIAKPAGSRGFERAVVVDGKAAMAPGAATLVFSPDGSRYAHLVGNGSAKQVAVDGRVLEGMVLLSSGDANARIVFSPDGRHVAYAAAPDQNSQQRGIAIDGRFFPTPAAAWDFNVTFTPDSKHLVWDARLATGGRWAVFVDGEPVQEFERTPQMELDADVDWAMGADGALTLVAQDAGSVKRWRIAPSGGGIESMLAKAIAPR